LLAALPALGHLREAEDVQPGQDNPAPRQTSWTMRW
jgi:hypothetical protein